MRITAFSRYWLLVLSLGCDVPQPERSIHHPSSTIQSIADLPPSQPTTETAPRQEVEHRVVKPARYRTISEKLWVPNETRQTWVDDHERKGKDGKSIHVKGHWRTVPGEGGHWETVTKQILVEEEIVEAVEKLKPAAPPPVSKPLNDEGVVANQLKMARILKNNGNTAAAIKRLEEIVRKSPDTEAAREANELLTKLK